MKSKVWTQMIYSINDIRVLSVNRSEMIAEWNCHAAFYMDGNISDTDEEKLEKLLYSDDMIKVLFQEVNGNQHILFAGYLKNLEIERNKFGCHFKLNLTGFTQKMDVVERKRVFQNKAMTYEQIISEVLKPYGYDMVFSDIELGKGTNQILVQYHETDWEFIKRLASHFHIGILGNYSSENKYISIGLCESQEKNLMTETYTIISSNHECDLKKTNGITELIDEDSIAYKCTVTACYDVGAAVIFQGKKFYIEKAEMNCKSGELVFLYELRRKNAFSQIKQYNNQIIGAALDGVISDIKNDMVKIHIIEGDNASVENSSWMPYSTVYSSPDGTGWYCMPEIGDKVRVYFPNEIEECCYVISSVHSDGGNMGSMRSNPNNKSIATKFGKQIELTPSDIKISNGNGMLICISDTDGILVVSKEDIILKADGNISLISSNDSVDICAAESIILKQGENTITIEDEILLEGTKVKVQ